MPWSNVKKEGSEYRDIYILQYRVDDEGWRTTGNYARRKEDYNTIKAIIKRDMLNVGHKKVVFKTTKRKKIYWHGLSFPFNAKGYR